MIPTAWEHHSGEADVCLYPTICCTNISSECGKYWKVLQFLPNSCDKTWIRSINWSKFCPCASVWQVLTAKTVIVAFLSSPALIGHCTLLHLSSFPFFVENTQTKALIITLIPSSESALYPSFLAVPAAPVQMDFFSLCSHALFPDCFQFVLEKSLLIPSSSVLPETHWALPLFPILFPFPFTSW